MVFKAMKPDEMTPNGNTTRRKNKKTKTKQV